MTMTALAKTNSHARVRLTVRKWKMTTENRAQATTRAASPRKVWRPSAWLQEAVGLGPVVVGDDGGGVGSGRVPTGGADLLLTPSGQAGQAPHAP